MVCFFSVFTHLLHEQSYVYLQEAKRVLKPGGKIIFSFIEFSCEHHWQCFEAAITEIGLNLPLYVFIERNAITAWAPSGPEGRGDSQRWRAFHPTGAADCV